MGDNPSFFSPNSGGRNRVKTISDEELKLFPVENVSWDDTQEFIMKLNEKERGRGYLYRLPTETAWEYACRGGATSEDEGSYHFYFGGPTNDLFSFQANFDGNYPEGGRAPMEGQYLKRPTRVGAYPSNKLGLCDMHGNVWQWCADRVEDGASGWVIRGGGWRDVGLTCRAANRSWRGRSFHDELIGFRLARVPVRLWVRLAVANARVARSAGQRTESERGTSGDGDRCAKAEGGAAIPGRWVISLEVQVQGRRSPATGG
jgi:formylglycine-generating enzyme required for sulfatase activity